MKKLIRKPQIDTNHHMEFKEDVARIIKICADRDFVISAEDACWSWEKYSENWAAGWLGLGLNDEDVFSDVMEYMMDDGEIK